MVNDLVQSGRLTREEFDRAYFAGVRAYDGDGQLSDNPHGSGKDEHEDALCSAWDQGYVERMAGNSRAPTG